MQPPVVKGDGKIILSFKENQCVVETEYDPAPPPPPPAPVAAIREPTPGPPLPFYQTIMAGNPQGSSWLTALVVFQAIAVVVGILILIGIGGYLIYRDKTSQGIYEQSQSQIKNQEATIQLMQVELHRLQTEIQKLQPEGKKGEGIRSSKTEAEATPSDAPMIETNTVR